MKLGEEIYAEDETRDRYKQNLISVHISTIQDNILQKQYLFFLFRLQHCSLETNPFVSCNLSLFLRNLGNLLSGLVFSPYYFTEMIVCNSHSVYCPLKNNFFFFVPSDLLLFSPSLLCGFSYPVLECFI